MVARIEKTIEVDCPAAELWSVVGDLGAMADWFPGLTASSLADGVRRCTMADGGELVEEITARDDDARRYEYRMTEAPMAVQYHRASMSVDEIGADRSSLTWVTEIVPDGLAAAMEPILEAGMRSLQARFERRAGG